MKGLTYFTAIVALFAAMIFGQNSAQNPTPPPSDQGNSTNSSAQPQNATTGNTGRTARMHDRVPDTTIRDQQHSTTSSTGASAQNNNAPSPASRGTSSNPPEATVPSNTSPSSPPPQASLTQTPAARAAATHTPDPGTCMNPAALEPGANGAPRRPVPPCE